MASTVDGGRHRFAIPLYLGMIATGIAVTALVLSAGRSIEPAPSWPPLASVDGPGAACLGERLASVQSGTFLDLRVPGPAGSETTEEELGSRVGSGRIDRSTQVVTLEGTCAPDSVLSQRAFEAELEMRARGERVVDVTGHLSVGGRELRVEMRPDPRRGSAAPDDTLTGSELVARIFLAVAIVIVVARLVGSLVARLRQPRVMGEIVAGILLGPSLLGIVAPGVVDYLFPPEVTAVLKVLAQFGLIFFMFLVGLELDSRLLRGSGHTALLVSHASIIAPFVLGLVAALWLYPMLGGGSFTGFALFMGAAMAITAFPVLARILTDTGLHRTRLGTLAITCAAVDDVTAWCILAIVVAVVEASGAAGAAVTIVLAVAFISFMLFVIRPVAARLARVHEARGSLSPPAMATLLVGVLVAAWVTETIGIHAIFGGFLAGVVMPRSPRLVAEVRHKLEDMTVLLLLPIFFAVVGLSTNITLLGDVDLWIVTLAVIGVAVIGKWGGAMLGARAGGEGLRTSATLGVLMNTRGLTEIVILTIGRSLGVISPALFTIMVLMALVTTFMAMPLIHLLYPRRLLDREMELAAVEATRHRSVDYRVVVAVGDPAAALPELDVAASLCGPSRVPPEIVLARVVSPPGREEVRANLADLEDAAADALDELAGLAGALARRGVDARLRASISEEPGAELARVAEREQADLILLGPHRPYVGRNLLGGVVAGVLDRTTRDVAVLVNGSAVAPVSDGPVVVWYRRRRDDRAALEVAARIAQGRGCSLRVIRGARHGVPASAEPVDEVVVAHDCTATDAVAHAEGASVVVIGHPTGSSPDIAAFETLGCPILVVRSGPVSAADHDEAASEPVRG